MKLWDLSGHSEKSNIQEAYLPKTSVSGQIVSEIVACMTGALGAKWGERDISCRARHEHEARGKEKNKVPVHSPLFLLFRPLPPTSAHKY